MSAPMIIPFDNYPANVGSGNTTYTVPLGKFARLNVCVHTSASGNVSLANQNIVLMENQSNSIFGTYWLKYGDVITVSNTVANATASPTASNNQYLKSASLSALIINGQSVLISESICAIAIISALSGVVVSISGNASVNYRYEEYNVIS